MKSMIQHCLIVTAQTHKMHLLQTSIYIHITLVKSSQFSPVIHICLHEVARDLPRMQGPDNSPHPHHTDYKHTIHVPVPFVHSLDETCPNLETSLIHLFGSGSHMARVHSLIDDTRVPNVNHWHWIVLSIQRLAYESAECLP